MDLEVDAESAARHARQEQLDRLERFLNGEETSFMNHQGTEMTFTYDPADYEREKHDKITFDKNAIFLSIAQQACESNETEELEEYLEKNGDVDVNTATADGVTALHTACIEGSLKVASLLVRKDIDVNNVDIDWWTPLHTCAATGNWRIARLLISNGADITAVNTDGELPIDLAEDEKTKDIIEQEMDSAGYTEDKRDALREKPETAFLSRVKSAIEEVADLDAGDEHGIRMVHIAACNGWTEALDLLIKNGADVNAVDDENQTPLHYAVFFEQHDIIKALAAAGVDPTIKNKYHEPAMHMTEDPMIIRIVQNLCKEKQRDSTPQPTTEVTGRGKSKRAYDSVKRKTLTGKGGLKKLEAEQEKSLVKDLYAEIKFSKEKDRRASEWQQRDEEVIYNKVVYTHITFKNKDKDGEGAEGKGLKRTMTRPTDIIESDDEDEMATSYRLAKTSSTANKTGTGTSTSSNSNSKDNGDDDGDEKKSKRASDTRAAVKQRPAATLPPADATKKEDQASCCVIS